MNRMCHIKLLYSQLCYATVTFSQYARLMEEQEHLQQKANWFSLVAIGVGAVISGNFFGWQFGLLSGGFLGMLIATIIIACLYTLLLSSVAEMSTLHPSAGGFYTFTELAFGRFIGFICGISICIEYISVPTVVVTGIGGYLHNLTPIIPAFVWWIIAYAIFLAINIAGVSLTFLFGCIVTVLSILVLAFFYLSSIFSHSFRWSNLWTIAASHGHSTFLPHGMLGLWLALPFAMWLFIGVEEMPMAAEETKNVEHNMPKALAISIITLFILAVLTVIINGGTGQGANFVARSNAPLLTGFMSIYGFSLASKIIFTLLSLVGLVASVHSLTFAFGRIIYAMGREKNLPKPLAKLNKNKSPHIALITGGVIGLICMFVIEFFSSKFVSAILLNMAVFGAVISYILVLLSYIRLRFLERKKTRIYKSLFGIPGAVVGIILALFALVAILYTPNFRPGIWGLIVVLIIAIVYYFLKEKLFSHT